MLLPLSLKLNIELDPNNLLYSLHKEKNKCDVSYDYLGVFKFQKA